MFTETTINKEDCIPILETVIKIARKLIINKPLVIFAFMFLFGCLIVFGSIIINEKLVIFKEYGVLEQRFGPLEPYTPNVTFVHFKTIDGYQIDCIRNEKGKYQFLAKTKIP